MKIGSLVLAGWSLFTAAALAADAPQPVTVENFVRAESDTYFANLLKESGRLGVFSHRREVS